MKNYHTNTPECCLMCKNFYENYIKKGKARLPTKKELQKQAKACA